MNMLLSIFLVFLLTVPAAGCAKKTDTVRVVLDWAPNTNHTGLYVALEKGWYSDAGFGAEILQPPEDGALALVGAGMAEFGVDFQESLGMALASDAPPPVIAVAAILQHNTSGIVTLKSAGVASPKDLAGKRYATWGLPLEQAILKSVVETDGGNFGAVELIPQYVTDVVSALQTNIDAVWIYEGWDGVAVKQAGLDTNYFGFADIDPVFDFYTPVLVANSEYCEKNRERAAAFLAATAKGYEYAAEHPDEAAEILLKHAPELGKELVRESQAFVSPRYRDASARWGRFEPARWDAFYGWMFEQGLLPRDIRGEGFTNEYLPG